MVWKCEYGGRLFSGEYRQCFQEMYAEAAFCFAARASEGSRVLKVGLWRTVQACRIMQFVD